MISQTLADEEVVKLIRQKRYEDLPVLLTPSQAAAVLGVTTRTVQKYCNEGPIEAVRVGLLFRIPTDKFISSFGLDK